MHRFANPARFLSIAKPLTPALFWPGLLLVLGACWWGLVLAPAERLMGDTVKIMFVHVPAAWLGMAAGPGSRLPASCNWSGGIRWPALRRGRLRCRARFCRNLPDYRFDLGTPDLGNMVGVGRSVDLDACAVFPLSWLYCARQCLQRKGPCQPHRRGVRHHWCGQYSDHQPFGGLVGKPASKGEHHAGRQCQSATPICGLCSQRLLGSACCSGPSC